MVAMSQQPLFREVGRSKKGLMNVISQRDTIRDTVKAFTKKDVLEEYSTANEEIVMDDFSLEMEDDNSNITGEARR